MLQIFHVDFASNNVDNTHSPADWGRERRVQHLDLALALTMARAEAEAVAVAICLPLRLLSIWKAPLMPGHIVVVICFGQMPCVVCCVCCRGIIQLPRQRQQYSFI